MINYVELHDLINREVVVFKKEAKLGYEDKNFMIAYIFLLVVMLFPIFILLYGLVTKPNDVRIWFFLTILLLLFFWFSMQTYNRYLLHKRPLDVFWKHFINKKAKLFLIGPTYINGKEYMLHGFKERGSGALGDIFVITISIRKDIYERAMNLMEDRNYSIAVDSNGREKIVVNGGERVEDVDKDTILVMKFIETLYALYGDDINELRAKSVI